MFSSLWIFLAGFKIVKKALPSQKTISTKLSKLIPVNNPKVPPVNKRLRSQQNLPSIIYQGWTIGPKSWSSDLWRLWGMSLMPTPLIRKKAAPSRFERRISSCPLSLSHCTSSDACNPLIGSLTQSKINHHHQEYLYDNEKAVLK